MTHWIYNNQPIDEVPDGYIGFVYRITNLESGKLYIGKKNFFSTQSKQKTVVLKTTGEKKKKKVRTTKESDWRSYYGSSDDVRKDVDALGEASFKREILRLCSSKGELSYYEAKYQFVDDVLLYPERYYNNWISVRVQRVHLKKLLDTSR